MAKKKRNYGWHPDLPDHRDLIMAAPAGAPLPPSVDLRGPGYPAPYDQGQLGSCTGNAIAGAMEIAFAKEQIQRDGYIKTDSFFMPSRLFIYYNERALEGTIDHDAGAQIRDGIKVVHKLGAPPESLWPYAIRKFKSKPTAKVFNAALGHQVTSYHRVTRAIESFKGCLADGFPFVFGFTVYDGFESELVARTGVLEMPARGEQILGGHAVLCVGYDDASQRFLIRNSWGTGWGQAGHFTMPYDYLMHAGLSSDFWTIRLVEE
jgi:C1A family cysteine protease